MMTMANEALKNNAGTIAAMYAELDTFGDTFRDSDVARDDSMIGAMRVLSRYVMGGTLEISKELAKEKNKPFNSAFARFRFKDTKREPTGNDANIRSKFKAICLATVARMESKAPEPTFIEVLDSLDATLTSLRKAKQSTKSGVEAYYAAANMQRKNKDSALSANDLQIAAKVAAKSEPTTKEWGEKLVAIVNALDAFTGVGKERAGQIVVDDNVSLVLRTVKAQIDAIIPPNARLKGNAKGNGLSAEDNALLAKIKADMAAAALQPPVEAPAKRLRSVK